MRHQPDADRAGRPVGILAAVLALLVAWGGALAYQGYAVRLAEPYAHALAAQSLPLKWETVTLQRAAYATGHLLPIYGSSELYCCGDPMRGTQIFDEEPTGFDLFAVGRAGTADLFFFETFAALGGDLRGRRLIVSDSPPWFFSRGGINPKAYDGNFSPEIAEMFAFDAPISLGLREAGARRMLDYPETLADQPLLRLALESLADGSPGRLAEYYALLPVGRIDSLIRQTQDASDTVRYIRDHPGLTPDPPDYQERTKGRALNWTALARLGSDIAHEREADNPYGFPVGPFKKIRKTSAYRDALALYCSGRTNRDGQVYPEPRYWESNMRESAEWTDLALELRVLREVGADPLLWSLPMPGPYDDDTRVSRPARQLYYQQFERVVRGAGVPGLDFAAHDEDRYFLTDTGAHFSPRGWVFADRAADLFWHGRPIGEITSTLRDLNTQSPSVPLPPLSGVYCRTAGG